MGSPEVYFDITQTHIAGGAAKYPVIRGRPAAAWWQRAVAAFPALAGPGQDGGHPFGPGPLCPRHSAAVAGRPGLHTGWVQPTCLPVCRPALIPRSPAPPCVPAPFMPVAHNHPRFLLTFMLAALAALEQEAGLRVGREVRRGSQLLQVGAGDAPGPAMAAGQVQPRLRLNCFGRAVGPFFPSETANTHAICAGKDWSSVVAHHSICHLPAHCAQAPLRRRAPSPPHPTPHPGCSLCTTT